VRLTPGTRVGPYEVVALLGAGGMAEVYRAKDTRLGREVAIKVVSEALGGDAALLERFEREAKLAASLAHPNVVALHDVGFHEGKPYFVTELLQGTALRERLVEGAIPLATALEWAEQMAQGLAAAHERGIAHRDLKPENIFITRDGHLKLLDFGIAKLVEEAKGPTPHGLMDATVSPSGSNTGTGMVLGTPGYMSPEQVRGEALDARTDFFSFGAVLYEMVCGSRAFPASSIVESGYSILHSEPEPLPATVPSGVAHLVRRCLEKDPARRFESARDLAFNLELLRTPTGSSPPMPAPSIPTSVSGWRVWLLPVAGALLALAVGLTLFPRKQLMPKVEQVTFRLGRVSAARISPEGRVIFSAAWDGQPLELFSTALGSPEAQSLGLREADLLAISSSGELAVSLHSIWSAEDNRGTLAVVPSAGGVPKEVAENIGCAAWSSTGELAVVRILGAKRQLEYPLGTPIFETTGFILAVRVSPGGDALAILHWPSSGPHEVTVLDRKGTVKSSIASEASGIAWAPNGSEIWFSSGNALWTASAAGGERRLAYQGLYELRLDDISREGALLVTAQNRRREATSLLLNNHRAQQLSWLDTTELDALSADGQSVLFTGYPGGTPFVYVRPTDGSLPVKLGPGTGLALSPDKKWVLAHLSTGEPGALQLLPVGVGMAKSVSLPGFIVVRARFLRDGKRFIFSGRPVGDRQFRLYAASVEGGPPTPISESAVGPFFFAVSRDDRFVAVNGFDLDGVLVLPLDGGAPISVPDSKGLLPAGWSNDGQLWVREGFIHSRAMRIDIHTGHRSDAIDAAPSDLVGLDGNPHRFFITPDGQAVAFDYIRILGNLFVMTGLVPNRH
jgi:eukaryotic-like serine/threonine-protein kinase